MSPQAVLRRVLLPALRAAVRELERLDSAPLDAADRERLAAMLASAAERAQLELGERSREPAAHRVIGAAASAAMALSFGEDAAGASGVRSHLATAVQAVEAADDEAGSWSPEDQDPA